MWHTPPSRIFRRSPLPFVNWKNKSFFSFMLLRLLSHNLYSYLGLAFSDKGQEGMTAPGRKGTCCPFSHEAEARPSSSASPLLSTPPHCGPGAVASSPAQWVEVGTELTIIFPLVKASQHLAIPHFSALLFA